MFARVLTGINTNVLGGRHCSPRVRLGLIPTWHTIKGVIIYPCPYAWNNQAQHIKGQFTIMSYSIIV